MHKQEKFKDDYSVIHDIIQSGYFWWPRNQALRSSELQKSIHLTVGWFNPLDHGIFQTPDLPSRVLEDLEILESAKCGQKVFFFGLKPTGVISTGYHLMHEPCTWPNGIIFHQPRFPWNKGISRNLSYLLGAQVVWGRYNLTRYIPFSGIYGMRLCMYLEVSG